MDKTVTVATFPNSMDIRMNLFKDMLEAASIDYILVNEHGTLIEGSFTTIAGTLGIEIRVSEENVEKAIEIYESIE